MAHHVIRHSDTTIFSNKHRNEVTAHNSNLKHRAEPPELKQKTGTYKTVLNWWYCLSFELCLIFAKVVWVQKFFFLSA